MTHSAAAAEAASEAAKLFHNLQQLQQLLDKNTNVKQRDNSEVQQLQITHALLRYSVTLLEHSVKAS